MSEICRVTKEKETFIITTDQPKHIFRKADGKFAYSIAKDYGMTVEQLKTCNTHISRADNGDLKLNEGDILNVGFKKIVLGVATQSGDKQPKSVKSCAPWMDVAFTELKEAKGVSEKIEPLASMVIKYHKYVAPENNYDANISWCASFVSWCLNEAGITNNPKTMGSAVFINHQTLKKIDKPIFGAIAVFRDFIGLMPKDKVKFNSNKVLFDNGTVFNKIGGYITSISDKDDNIIFDSFINGYRPGHVTFIYQLPISRDDILYGLGGNQDGKLSIKGYDYTGNLVHSRKNIYRMFMGFFIPKNFIITEQCDKIKRVPFGTYPMGKLT